MPTATIFADKDTYIDKATPTAASSTYAAPDSATGLIDVLENYDGLNTGHGTGTTGKDGLIGFPGTLPAGAVISAATLNVKVKTEAAAGGGINVGTIGDFDELNAKWNDYVHGTGSKTATPSTYVLGHTQIASGVSPAVDVFMVFNVLGYVLAAARASFILWGDMPTNTVNKVSYTEVTFYPSENATSTNRPFLSVTYAEAPGAPGSITVPVAGASYDASIALFAGQATDPDTPQASLQYEWSYQLNGGAWTVIPGLTTAGTTAKTWNTSAIPFGTTYKVRIRAWDGANFGPYTTMTGVFTIAHGSRVKSWDGSAWVPHYLLRWNGSAWVNSTLKRWDGTAWQVE